MINLEKARKILVTGGAGFVGSHVLSAFENTNDEIFVIDDLSSGSLDALKNVELILKRPVKFFKIDLLEKLQLLDCVSSIQPDVCIHLAGFKSVKRSGFFPLEYYDNNVTGLLNLLFSLERTSCRCFVFSSSATVYGAPEYLPYDENHIKSPSNVYGRTKLACELILEDWFLASDREKAVIALRYFNPLGAHPSLIIGENFHQNTENLMPVLLNIVDGSLNKLSIFGNDYPTNDGTPARDYIHVMDVATAHLRSIDFGEHNSGFDVFNIGLGKPITVLELISEFEKVSGIKISYEFSKRRNGDLGIFYADPTMAIKRLSWSPIFGLKEMCLHSWGWVNEGTS